VTREAEIAYAAGIFDGEGCITGTRGKNDIHIAVTMGDEDCIRRFGRIVGCGTIGVQTQFTDPGPRKPMWRWQADGAKAERIVRLLLPYLGQRRTARAHELLGRRERWRAACRRARTCSQCGVEFCPARANATASRQRHCSRRCGLRFNWATYGRKHHERRLATQRARRALAREARAA
jgi:hypothetical protein